MAGKGYEVGTAYVAIMPQTKDLTRQLGSAVSGSGFAASCAKEGKKGGEGLAANIKGALKGAAITTAGVTAGKMLVDGIKDAIDKYATFEQLEGGVEKIFDQADTAKVFEDASNAYKDLNMSANDYLESITQVGATFAATMGDQAGYDTARKGMLAIADYASGTGRNLGELNEKYQLITRSTSSYQSIADQFSGILPATSSAFLEQAQAAGYLSGEYTKLTEVPIEEYQQAVTNMLEKGVDDMGLLGNTAAESTSTISGSLAMTQSAWDNFVTDLGRGNTDITESVTRLGESAFAAFSNIGERIPVIVSGVLTALPALATQASQYIVSAASSAIEEYGPQIQTWFEELPGNVGTWINGKISSVFDAGNTIIGEIVKGLSGDEHATMETFFTGLPDTVSGWITGAAETLQQQGRDFIAGLLFGTTEVTDGELKQKIEGLPGEIVGFIGDVASTLFDTGSSLLQGLLNGISEISPTVIEFFTSLPTVLLGFIGDVATTLADKGREFLGGFLTGSEEKEDGDVKSNLEGLPSKLLGFLPSMATTLGEKGREFVNGFLDGYNELVSGDLATTLGGFLGAAAEVVGSAIATLAQTGIDFIMGFLTGAKQEQDGESATWFSGFLELIKGIITTGINVVTFLGEIGTSLIAGFLDGVTGGKWTEIKEWFSKLPETLKKKIGNIGSKLKQKGIDFLTGFKTGVENIGAKVGTWISNLPGTLVKLIGSLGSKLKEKGKDFITGFKEGAENIGSQVGTWINKLPSTLVTLIGSVGKTLFDKGKDILQGLFDGIKNIFNAPDGVSNFFSNLMEEVKGLIPNPIEALKGIGEDVIKGFIEGVQSISLKPILEAIFGTDLANAICGVLGIQSPSRVTKEFGKDTTQGFANGLKDSSATSSVTANAKALRGNVESGLGDTSTLLTGKGKSATQSFANGLNDASKTGGVKTNAYGLRGYATNGLGDTSGLLTGAGKTTTGSYASGLNDRYKTGEVWQAGNNLPNYVYNGLHSGRTLSSFLFGSGSATLAGYINGLYDDVQSKVSSWGSYVMRLVQNNKGPIEKDRQLLIENGRATMEGYVTGLMGGWDDVKATLLDITKDIPATVDMGLNVAPWSNAQVNDNLTDVYITGNTFYVRGDDDIERIAEQLNDLVNRQIAGAVA